MRLVAEGVGFEPTIRLPVYTLSKRAPSATRPSLRGSTQYSKALHSHNPARIRGGDDCRSLQLWRLVVPSSAVRPLRLPASLRLCYGRAHMRKTSTSDRKA